MKHLLYILLVGSLLFITSCSEDVPNVEGLPSSELAKDQSADLVLKWYDLYLDIEKDLPDFRPNPTARALAYIGLAGYEAANLGMPHYKSYESFNSNFKRPAIDTYKEYYWPAAVNAAYAEAFKYFLFSMNQVQIDKVNALEIQLNTNFKLDVSDAVISNSISWGKEVAAEVIALAKQDIQAEVQVHDIRPASYNPVLGEGKWKPTPPDFVPACHPYWGSVKTFFIPQSVKVGLPPIPFSNDPNSSFYKEALEVNDAIQNLNYDDRWIAEFWSDDLTGLTFSPPARQFAIGNQLIQYYNLNLEDALHFYLKLGFSINDAAVACWNSKYYYNVERPVDYIQRLINPSFKPILGDAVNFTGQSPSFPAYPSGHSTFASAAAGVFVDFFGSSTNFYDRCHERRTEFIGTPRRFNTFHEMATENAFSRIPLGVHFRMDCVEGLRMGYEVADYINQANFRK